MTAEWSPLQRWFLEVVRAPGSLDEALTEHAPLGGDRPVEQLLTRSSRATEKQRLAVYRHAYFARLEECLDDDFPAVRAGLGDDEFGRLAREYAVHHPSRSFTLNVFGARFPSFLRERDLAFWSELATLEWALVEAVHSKAPVSTLADDLGRLGADGIAGARLTLNAECSLLDARYPVNRVLQAFFSDGTPPTPPGEESPSSVLVLRQNYKLWRLDLDPRQRTLLGRLRDGTPLGAALDGLDVTPTDVQTWFGTWAEKGVLVGATPTGAPQRAALTP